MHDAAAMLNRLALLGFVVWLSACTDQVLTREDKLACGFEKHPSTVEQCVCVGARVEGDPGDGSASCDLGEQTLGRVPFGIEGAVCCLD
jgi:hypothetical protein